MKKKLEKIFDKKYNLLLLLLLLFFVFFLFDLDISFAKSCGGNVSCDCGDTVTSDYKLSDDLICNSSNGLYLNALNLDCNNFSILGKQNYNGLIITGGDNINIKNCNIKNFSNGVVISKRRYLNGNGWGAFWYDYDDAINTKIFNSTFENNLIGISSNGRGDVIFSNIFKNNLKYGVNLGYISKVYNNKFYNTSIHYSSTSGKTFCDNNVGNFYFNTTGPQCDCILLFDGLGINSNVRVCPKDYNLNHPLSIASNVNLNCNGANLINNGSGVGVEISGSSHTNINHCNFYNFSTAIYSKIYFYTDYRGIHTANNPDFINVENNNFYNNLVSISLTAGYDDKILNNSFINDKSYSIGLHNSKVNIFNNLFDGNPSSKRSVLFSSFRTKFFCDNNISNVYLGKTSGPTCDCIVPRSGMNLDISVKFCKGDYNLTSPIKISSGVEVDCNGVNFYGNKNINAMNLIDTKNTLIKNCNFENFKNGIYYARSRYSYYNNSIVNNSFFNLINAVYLENENINPVVFNQTIINNSFINLNYGIYNKVNGDINAKYNVWQTNNVSKIKNKIFNSSNVSFVPFKLFVNRGNDLFINKNSINLDLENNILSFNIFKNNFYYIDNFDLKIIQFRNNSLINQKDFNVSGNFTYRYFFNLNLMLNSNKSFDFKKGDKIIIILDYNNKINELNENNNIYNYIIQNNQKIFVEDNSYNGVIDYEFKKYLKFIFDDFKFTNNKSEADIIVDIEKSKNSKNSIKNYFNYLKLRTVYFNRFAIKPYEGKVLSINENNTQNIVLIGEDLEGNIASIKELARNKQKYLYSNNLYIINGTNIDAIKIFDNLHSFSNEIYFKKKNEKFQNILKDILYDNLYKVENIFIPVKTLNNQTINYKMQRLIPQYSDNLLNYINKNNSYPIILAGGLWSDISTWSKLGGELANDGQNPYLIEITGGKNSECDNCYNYPYDFLTDRVFPAYIKKVQEMSNSTKIKYIGHSNGARVALDSLSKREVNQSDFDTLVTVGVPGAFEGEKISKKVLYGLNRYIDYKNNTHISMVNILFKNLFGNKFNLNKISLNLWNKYYFWMSNETDLEPGINLSLNKYILIAGNLFNNGNDGIVTIEDERKIFNNINSSNKKYFQGNLFHVGMSENKDILNYIKKNLN